LIGIAGGGDGGVELGSVLGAVKSDVQGDGSGGVRSIADDERQRNRTGQPDRRLTRVCFRWDAYQNVFENLS